MKDYYSTLEIDKSANAVAVRKAYRKLALELHPDVKKSPDAHDKFIELAEAYEVLKSPKRKHQYDRLYDYHILNKSPRRHRTYQNRERKWKENVNRASNRGKAKGERSTATSDKIFERRTKRWSFSDPFCVILELLHYLLSFIFDL